MTPSRIDVINQASAVILRRTLIGALVGLAMALLLLALAIFGGGESGEGAWLLASILGMPTTLLFQWGDYASQWNAYIASVLPLNGLVLGFSAALIAQFWRWNRRRWIGTLAALWILAFVLTYAFAR